jgi:hypothetical protein
MNRKGLSKKVGHLSEEELAARTMRALLVHTVAFGVCVALLMACSLSEEADAAQRWLDRVWATAGSAGNARIAALRLGTDPMPAARVEKSAPAGLMKVSVRSSGEPPDTGRRELSATEPVLAPIEAGAAHEPGVDPDPVLLSTASVTHIYRSPKRTSPIIGYLRAGAVVRRSAESRRSHDCAGGFFEIVPEGYVCAGKTASTDPNHAMARAVVRRANRDAGLPYVYGIAPHGGTPLYARVPGPEQQARVERDLAHFPRRTASSFDSLSLDPVPSFLEGGQSTFSPHGYRVARDELTVGTAIPRTGFSLISWFEEHGRRWGLTVDMGVVPLDRLRRVEPSTFHGLPLSDAVGLPVVFVQTKNAMLYEGDPVRGGLRPGRRLGYREAVAITGESAKVGKLRYLKTRSGDWLRDERLVKVDRIVEPRRGSVAARRWIDVSILKQTLVAYEGENPVFVTLVSTGVDGIRDAKTSRATIQGHFLIHTKHVSVTMSSDEVGDEFDLRDVPYVQYFTEGYALHAAYWHDGFGLPRSHGCINVSPLDARWLFGWTDPPVPAAWHGAMSLRGTLVSIHP